MLRPPCMSRFATFVLGAWLLPALAAAEPLELGARIGGYGFRENRSGNSDWHDCRMNGVGVFVDRPLAGPWFVEGGLDTYFAAGEGGHQHDGGAVPAAMDRVWGLFTVAGGVRFFRDARVSPFLIVGTGVELTRVSLPGLGEESFVLPMGFFGVGADLRLGRVSLGATIRVNAMGHFAHDAATVELSPEAELAAQAQFHARVAL